MRSFFILIFSLIISVEAYSQSAVNAPTDSIFVSVELQPAFPGGLPAFYKAITQNIKYPAKSRLNNEQGTVFVSFIVEKNGQLSNIEVVRHLTEELDAEALRVLNIVSSTRWSPAIQNGAKVRARFTVPISFKLALNNTVIDSVSNNTFTSVEEVPTYIGGLTEMIKFFRRTIKYRGTEGRVIVSFVIEKDGSLTDVEIVSKFSDKADEEVLRVMKLMPKWKPGMQNGRPVRVKYTMPIPLPFYR